MGVLAIAVKKPIAYIPTGLIVPYTAGAAPSGWASFASANTLNIIGAGSTYAVGDSGVGTGDIVFDILTAGAHTGVTAIDVKGNGNKWHDNSEAGDHSHTVTSPYTPPYQECYLIKAAAGNNDLPANSVVWTYGVDKSGVSTNIWTDGYMFKANSNVAAAGSNSIVVASTISGNHGHGNDGQSSDSSGYDAAVAKGAHLHTPAITMTNGLYKRLMGAWRNASSAIAVGTYGTGIIGMYESLTPPTGWVLCDGNNGSPDLRNYFIKNTTNAAAGSPEGDGSVTGGTAGTITHGTHNHINGNDSGFGTDTGYHGENIAMPAHAQLNQKENGWLPPYYALAFIMYGG